MLQFYCFLAGALLVLWTSNLRAIKPFGRSTASPSVISQDKTILAETRWGEGSSDNQFHYVFSTGCSLFQDWQSYMLFYHAKQILQANDRVTRVVSGCDAKETQLLQKAHEEQIQALSANFMIHFTPDYSRVIPGETYKFFNKPFGLRHWMTQGLGFDAATETNLFDNATFIILDPDQILIRRFERSWTAKSDESILWMTPPRQTPITIQHGSPVSQAYGFGGSWIRPVQNHIDMVLQALRDNGETVLSSRLSNVTVEEMEKHYAAGPPYIATGRDMYRIVSVWADIMIPVYKITKNHLSEMFAYSTAAAHLNLPHQLAHTLMVSNHVSEEEGWGYPDNSTGQEACATRDIPWNPDEEQFHRWGYPYVLHYCQRYYLGLYFFSKYKLTKSFLSCDHPLLKEPEIDFAERFQTSVTPDGTLNYIKPHHRNRMAFMLCNVIRRVNDAASYWKSQHCQTANTSMSFWFTTPEQRQQTLVAEDEQRRKESGV